MTTSEEAYVDWIMKPLEVHEIRELSSHRAHIPGRIPLYYAEGDSGPLWSGQLEHDGMDEPGYSWFAFEGLWVEMAMHLQRLGFTATQIMEARARDEN